MSDIKMEAIPKELIINLGPNCSEICRETYGNCIEIIATSQVERCYVPAQIIYAAVCLPSIDFHPG